MHSNPIHNKTEKRNLTWPILMPRSFPFKDFPVSLIGLFFCLSVIQVMSNCRSGHRAWRVTGDVFFLIIQPGVENRCLWRKGFSVSLCHFGCQRCRYLNHLACGISLISSQCILISLGEFLFYCYWNVSKKYCSSESLWDWLIETHVWKRNQALRAKLCTYVSF